MLKVGIKLVIFLGDEFKLALCRHCSPNKVVLWDFRCQLPHHNVHAQENFHNLVTWQKKTGTCLLKSSNI